MTGIIRSSTTTREPEFVHSVIRIFPSKDPDARSQYHIIQASILCLCVAIVLHNQTTTKSYSVVAGGTRIWRLVSQTISDRSRSTSSRRKSHQPLPFTLGKVGGTLVRRTPHKEARWHEVTKQVTASHQVVIISNHCRIRIRRSGLQNKIPGRHPDIPGYLHASDTNGGRI